MALNNSQPMKQSAAGYDVGQIQNYTPEQMNLFKSMFNNVGPDSYTSRLAQGDQSLFQEQEAPELRRFSELQGGIASRFSGGGGAGSLSNRRSSGFQNTMNQASSDFASDLASRRQGLQRQAIKDLHGMSGDLLNAKPHENYITDKKKSWWDKFLGVGGGAIGAGAGYLAGGPAGAKIGWDAGNEFSKGWNS